MSLKTDFWDGLTGFNEQMNGVFDAGVSFVTTNLATISTAMTDNAASGVTSFTVTIAASFEPANLRLKGNHMNAYFAGIRSGLAAEDIYDYEVSVKLNESDTVNLKIDLNFTL